ncbi:MAG: DinB family protein, partial [Candidatus Rokubacteria bacterium]|nr:DinB family protein [Candidatus Rokubacteria bacterium]
MPSFEDYRAASIDERVARLARTPGEVEAAIAGRSEADLRRRPDATNWAAVEVVCHLRDVEELFQLRFHTIVALEEPRILAFRATAAELEPWRVGGAIGHP